MQRSLATLGITALFVWVGAAPPHSGDGQLLYLGTQDGIAVVDTATGDKTFAAPDALPAGDGSQVIATRNLDDTSTMVHAVEPSTGMALRAQELDGAFEVRAVSRSGDLIALMPPEKHGSYLDGRSRPPSRTTTTIVLTRLDGTAPRTFELEANVEPEAFSNDEASLFVIQYSPPINPDRYRVNRLDLTTGAISEVFTNEKELQGDMRGTAYDQVLAPDGSALYTFYKQEDGEAFVHVLDLERQVANCVDLPEGFGEDPEAVGITTTPLGGRVVVVDGAARRLVDVDADSLRVIRAVDVHGFKPSHDALDVAATETDLLIATSDSLVDVNRGTLRRDRKWEIDGIVDVHAQAARLVLVAAGNRITALDPETGRKLWSITVDVGGIRAVSGVLPNTAKGTVDCAC